MLETFREWMKKILSSRLFLMGAVFIICICALVHRLFILQIVEGETYLEEYELSIQKTKTISATRGNIYDYNGVLLAYNELSYTVKIEDVYESSSTKNQLLNENIYTLIKMIEKNGDSIYSDFHIYLDENGVYQYDVSGTSLLRFKADVYGESYVEDLTYEQENATAEEMMAYLAGDSAYCFAVGEYETDDEGNVLQDEDGNDIFTVGKGYTKTEVLQIVTIRYAMSLVSYQVYLGTTVATDVSEATVAVIMENIDQLQGVSIEQDTVRRYTYGEYFSQILGYTGKISSTELEELNNELIENGEEARYTSSDVVGKTGIEEYMELELQGEKGYETVYVDTVGSVLATEDTVSPTAGNDVYLSIDSELQIACYDILEQSIAGILVAKIRNVKTYTMADNEDSSDIIIPIYDVYNALFSNNVISLSHMAGEDAGEVEQEVYSAYLRFKDDRYEELYDEVYYGRTAYNELSEEYQAYQEQLIEILKGYDVIDMDLVDTSDEVYQAWFKEETISLAEYLEYCISQNWIDVTQLNLESDYADSQEIFEKLIEFMFEAAEESSAYQKLILKYMIQTDTITGTQVCKILIEQEIVDLDDETIDALYSGETSAYQFMIARIQNLDITPAQLALDPYAGSVVVTDVNTGKVLALVSYPSYDNNKMANTVDADYYATLQSDQSNPLYNYAIQQKSAPGSTFKMVSTAAGLETGVIDTDTKITCTGIFDRFTTASYRCWIYPGAHGSLTASQAIQHSCNYFFYEVGYRLSLDENGDYDAELGLERLAYYADLFGLSETSGVEISESSPQVSTELPVLSAIGQGTNSYTTVGMARYVTTIANGGTCYNLTLLDMLTDSEGNVLEEYEAEVRNTVDLADSTWNTIHTGMRAVVENSSVFDDLEVEVAGKTGTAQESSSRPDHALFVGYAPYNDPEISVACRICYGYSSSYASQLAEQIFEYYFAEDKEEVTHAEASDMDSSNLANDN